MPALPDMSGVHHLLIVKLSAIGDVVHALPVASAIKATYPSVQVDWVVGERAAPIVQCHPAVSRVISLAGKLHPSIATARQLRRLRAQLRGVGYQVALDLQGLTKSALIAKLSGAPVRLGYDWLRELAPLLVRRVPRRPESVHIVDQLLDVARHLGADVSRPSFDLQIPAPFDAEARDLLAHAGVDADRRFAAINPSAGAGGNKGWRPDRFGEVAAALVRSHGMQVLLVGAMADLPAARAVRAACDAPIGDLVGATSLLQLASVLKLAALHVCGDTGTAHLAAALGTPVVSIFGRSDPDRLAPYGQRSLAVHRRDQCKPPCRALHARAEINVPQKCLAPPPACLEAVAVPDVLAAVERGLEICTEPRM